MNAPDRQLQRKPIDPRVDQIIKVAIMAVGGQGGGVLTNWVEDCARMNGYAVQATSVAGVAQRTGATIYYLEMAPAGDKEPVFSLLPAAGDVDVLVAAEMMEAGRAILRGFVTPDRTTLIASSHRALAVSEKTVPGDGIASAEEVMAAAEVAAQRLIVHDMETMALQAGSVISASLFGALAGAEVLPFPRDSFEAAIKASGRGVDASLRAFARGYDAARGDVVDLKTSDATPAARKPAPVGPRALLQGWQNLVDEIQSMPDAVQPMALAGLKKVVDFQDLDYGRDYLSRLNTLLGQDDAAHGHELTCEGAKYVANAMAYDDVIRVADLKTRGQRFARIRRDMKLKDAQVMQLTEFMHPRAEEIVGLLPAGLGRRVEANPDRMATIDRIFNHSRRLRSDTLRAFLQLYVLGGLRRYRRGTLRHAIESEHMEKWLSMALGFAATNYPLAVEILRCRRLIKGYSDTHARGLSKYDRVMQGIMLVSGREDAADWARRLRDAALQDEKGEALNGALQTVQSFA